MSSRDVRATISAGGATIAPISVECDFNLMRSSGTFRAQLALNDPNTSPDYWASTAPIEVEISMLGQQLFVGQVDTVSADYRSGALNIDGRDLSALLMDKRSDDESFINRPRWSVVSELAGRVGLGFVGGGGGGTVGDDAGKEWERGHHAAMEFSQSYWSIIERFAKLDGVSAYVIGRTLYYQKAQGGDAGTYNFSPQSPQQNATGNFCDIVFRRNLALAKTLKVSVNGWHAKKKKKVTGQATKPGQGGEIEVKTTRLNNVTDAIAQGIAQATLDDWADKEFGCTVTIPGDPSKRNGSKMTISGTAFDGAYTLEGIHHSVSIHAPYITRLSGRKGR